MTDVRRVLECRGGACGLRMHAPGRRGIALLLVLGVLAAVTILTAGALTSQQNAPTMGQNAAAEVQAKWSAESAAEIAAAVLETEFDYSGANAQMMVDQLIARGMADVSITTLSGGEPTPHDRELLLRATASVSGVTREITKRVSLSVLAPPSKAADAYYTEFGVVASEVLDIDSDALVASWKLSPDTHSPMPVAIGVFTASGDKVEIEPSANLIEAALFAHADADPVLDALIKAPNLAPKGARIPYSLPLAAEPIPASLSSLPVAASDDIQLDGTGDSATLSTGGLYKKVEVKNGAVLTLDASNGTHYSFETLKISSDGVVVIKGAVLLEMRNRLEVKDGATLALADDRSALAAFVTNDITLEKCGIGTPVDVARANDRGISSLTVYQRPDRIRIFARSKDNSRPNLKIRDRALVRAVIHAPQSEFTLENATLVGRASAKRVLLKRDSELYYDPRLDRRVGFTQLNGPLYGENGTALPSLAELLDSFSMSDGARVLSEILATFTAAPTLELAVSGDGEADTTDRNARVVHVAPLDVTADLELNAILGIN